MATSSCSAAITKNHTMSISTNENVPNVIIMQHPLLANPQLGTVARNRPVVEIKDLNVLSNWVKKELFDKVKFLYDPDSELRVNGDLYYHFVCMCKDKLIGLKGTKAVGENRRLWQEANQKKKNLVANGLTMRRSSVYSAMQNQFVGMFYH